jgi:tetratricopeptide (TPR) repeat protein
MELSRKAEGLASRGAYYAARAEMIKALRSITQALDSQRGGMEHSEALARAMRAFKEAGDFAPRGSQLEAELNLDQIISGHRTPILQDVNVSHMAPLTAQQEYLEYAQEQFAEACGDLSMGSYALYGLARVYAVMEHAKIDSQTLCLPKAVTLHQAAMLVDAGNVRAANELGVLLARFGQLEDSRRVLLHAISIQPATEIWLNLAVVHHRLGEMTLARQAHEQGTLMARRQTDSTRPGIPAVQWVDPETFSSIRPGPGQ